MRQMLDETAGCSKSDRFVGILKPSLEPRYHGTGYFPKRLCSGEPRLRLLVLQQRLENRQALFL